jgi:hypothetical protein
MAPRPGVSFIVRPRNECDTRGAAGAENRIRCRASMFEAARVRPVTPACSCAGVWGRPTDAHTERSDATPSHRTISHHLSATR